MKLNSENVRDAFKYCLFKEGEQTDDAIIVEGIVINVGFHPGRIREKSSDIEYMLCQLPNEFMEHGGGGWSFLNACYDFDGNQWTGDHEVMDELFMLGMATGNVTSPLPREIWPALPGGVPYYVVSRGKAVPQ